MRKTVAVISALLLVGCAGRVTIETTVTGPNGYTLEQKISGNTEAVIEAAGQLLDVELHANKEGEIDVYINSGQDAVGIKTKADEVLRSIGAAVVERLPTK